MIKDRLFEDRLAWLEAKARVNDAIMLSIILELSVEIPGSSARIIASIERFAASYDVDNRIEPALARGFVSDLLIPLS